MEKKKSFIIGLLYYLSIAGIVYVVLRYAIFVIMPFLIGFLVAVILNPAVRSLKRKYHLKRKPTAVFVLLIFYTTIGMAAGILVVRLASMVGSFSGQLPTLYSDTVEPFFERAALWTDGLLNRFDGYVDGDFADTVGGLLESVRNSVGNAVSDLSVRALSWLSSFAASIPRFIVELLFSVISGFFFMIDYEEIVGYLKSRLPMKAVGILTELRDKLFLTAFRYLSSYTLIMLLTFAELAVGLLILGTENAFLIALLIAFFDVLPIVGTGMIMIPWAAIELIRGNVGYGVGLIVVYAIVTVVRNIAEPRIVGRQVGLHPLCTLIAMFVGTKLFGFVGLILLPVGLSIAFSVIRDRDRAHQPGL